MQLSESELKLALEKLLMLFCSRITNLQRNVHSTNQSIGFGGKIMDATRSLFEISFLKFGNVPEKIFRNLVQNEMIPVEKLFHLALDVSLISDKAYHLLYMNFLNFRLFPDLNLKSFDDYSSWGTESFEDNLFEATSDILESFWISIEESIDFYIERRETINIFLWLILQLRCVRSVKDKQTTIDLWKNVIHNIKGCSATVLRNRHVDDDTKNAIQDIEDCFISCSVINPP